MQRPAPANRAGRGRLPTTQNRIRRLEGLPRATERRLGEAHFYLLSRSLLAAVLCLTLQCARPVDELDVASGSVCVPCSGAACDEPVEIRYLGAGGYRVERGRDVLLLAPHFSNPGLLEAAGIKRMRPRDDLIDAQMTDVSEARAILVGHSHYDHLLDIPRIATRHAPHAQIYTTETGAHILAAVPELGGRVVALDDVAWSPGQPQRWTRIGERIRVLAIRSEHAPHFAGITFQAGSLDADLDALPRRAWGWKGGSTLAFLIELLDREGARAEFRIHYQDSASNAPVGFPPVSPQPLDVAITCVASHHTVDGYPEQLIAQARPRHVILGHWEDFFRAWTSDPSELRRVRLTDPRPFIERMETVLPESSRWVLPAPGTKVVYARCSEVTPDFASPAHGTTHEASGRATR